MVGPVAGCGYGLSSAGSLRLGLGRGQMASSTVFWPATAALSSVADGLDHLLAVGPWLSGAALARISLDGLVVVRAEALARHTSGSSRRCCGRGAPPSMHARRLAGL